MSPKGKHSSAELSTGEKSAITRAVNENREIKFLEEHPEKKQAAEAYEAEVRARSGGESPKSPKSPRGKKK